MSTPPKYSKDYKHHYNNYRYIFCSDYIVLVKFVNLCVNFYLIDEKKEKMS